MPSLVNSLQQPPPNSQQQQLQQQSLKANSSLPLQQQPPQNMVQNQNALNNNDVNQSFSAQSLNANLGLTALLGKFFWFCHFFRYFKMGLTRLLIILENKNHGIPSLNALMPTMNSMNDKSVMNMLPNFDDPVEQSLASLEQSLACKLTADLSVIYKKRTSINEMIPGYDNPHHNNGNNGFNLDSTLNNLNGMTNVPPSVPNNNMMMGLPSLTQSNTLPPVTSLSDSISTQSDQRGNKIILILSNYHFKNEYMKLIIVIKITLGFIPGLTTTPSGNLPPASMNSSVVTAPINSNNSNTNNNNMNSSIQSAGNGVTTPNMTAGPIRAKPIEELLMPQHDKKSTPPALPPQMPMSEPKQNFANAFNKSMDPNINKTIAR